MAKKAEEVALLKSANAEGTALQVQDPMQLLAMAVEKGVTPEVLDKLLDVQQRWKAGQAQNAYDKALAAFKAKCPSVIAKTAQVDFTSAKGRTAYPYTPLHQILDIVTPLAAEEGLHLSWRTEQPTPQTVTVIGCLRHELGHMEITALTGPVDQSGNKNPLQAVASTVTYLQRYTAIALLGLATAEIDDDGQQGPLQVQVVERGKRQAHRQQPVQPVLPAPTEEVKRGVVREVQERSGKKKDKTVWTKYGIVLEEYRDTPFGTFSKTMAKTARSLVGQQVIARIEKRGRFLDLVELVPVETSRQEAVQSLEAEDYVVYTEEAD
jgi:hypothetical protein